LISRIGDIEDMAEFYIFIALGLVAGLGAGLLGIGGGSISLPVLYFILRDLGLPSDTLMQVVIGTTFAAMTMNALVSMLTHHFLSNISWKVFVSMLPGLILGPIVGAFIASMLHSYILRYAFGIVQCLLAIYFLTPHKEQDPYQPAPILLNIASFIIGTVGSILGIGGGAFLVPTLMYLNFPMKRAIGTSAAGTFLMISLATICYLYFGLSRETHAQTQAGFLYLPALLPLGLSSVIGAAIGAYFMKFVPINPLRKIFAIVQAALGLILIFG
jgi:uncharacterized membrane protein YfcA